MAEQTLSDWTPPEIWENKASGGRFANINRPTSGSTHEKDLPVGKHDFQLYSLGTPNGVKVTIMLEELLEAGTSAADYDAWLINIGEGDQFGSGFVDVNPNSKIPAMMDHSGETPLRIFESGSILMHLAEKFDMFLPESGPARTECLSWLFWQELDVLDQQLAKTEFIAGDDLTIADFAIYPWYGGMAKGVLYEAGEFLQVESYQHLQRWTKQLAARPAFRRGQLVNRYWDDKGLKERHDASDFDGLI